MIRNRKNTKIGAALLLATALCVTGPAMAAQAAPVAASRSVVHTATSVGTYAKQNCFSAQASIAARSDARIYRACHQLKSTTGQNVWSFQYIIG